MLVGLSGPAITLSPGDDHDFDDAEAKRLIAAGYAVASSPRAFERADKRPVREKRKAS